MLHIRFERGWWLKKIIRNFLFTFIIIIIFSPEVLHSHRDLETIQRIKAILELPSLVPTEIQKKRPEKPLH